MDLTVKFYCTKCAENGELNLDIKGNYKLEALEPEPVITVSSCDKCNSTTGDN